MSNTPAREMTTMFKSILKYILVLNKLIGLMKISNTVNSDGLLSRNINSINYYSFLELTRMIILVICSYTVHVNGVYYIQQFRLLKFWTVIILARLSEIRIIE